MITGPTTLKVNDVTGKNLDEMVKKAYEEGRQLVGRGWRLEIEVNGNVSNDPPQQLNTKDEFYAKAILVRAEVSGDMSNPPQQLNTKDGSYIKMLKGIPKLLVHDVTGNDLDEMARNAYQVGRRLVGYGPRLEFEVNGNVSNNPPQQLNTNHRFYAETILVRAKVSGNVSNNPPQQPNTEKVDSVNGERVTTFLTTEVTATS
jgi:hypothetical protein